MAVYRVVAGPVVTKGGMCCGPNPEVSGDPFAQIINQQAAQGWEFEQIFSHRMTGACLCILPRNVDVNLLVFRKG